MPENPARRLSLAFVAEFSDELSAALFVGLRSLPSADWLLWAYGLLVDSQRGEGVYFHLTLSDGAGLEWPFVSEERLFDPALWLAAPQSRTAELQAWWSRLNQLLPRYTPQQLHQRMARVLQAAESTPDEDLL